MFEIATGLEFDDAGYWAAPGSRPVSYPEDGNDFCLTVEDRSFWFAHRNRVVLAAVRRLPPPEGPFLDVGAGNGFVSAALCAAGFNVAAIEPNASGARNAANRGIDPVICGMLPSPAFRVGSAGGIGLFDVLEHVESDSDFLGSLRPYLMPAGRLYITVPAYSALWSAADVSAGHHKRYSLASLRSTIRSAGFELEYASHFFSWLPVPLLAFRALPYRLGRRTAGTKPSVAGHEAAGSWSRSILLRSLGFETAMISRGVPIPFGASCLAVATVV